jgi:hypothetical protein
LLAVGEPVLSTRAVQRAVLARQLLLERADLSVPEALRTLGGLQAQYAPSVYVGLWSRLRRFGRGDLTAALEDRRVVQGTLQRITIHLVERDDYWPFAIAVRRARRELWLRSFGDRGGEEVLVAAAERLRAALADGPLSRKEVEALVGKPLVNGVGLWLDLLRVPPSGTWERRRADRYADAERELGQPPGTTESAAREHLIIRYLTSFGPAGRHDVASYTGLPLAEVTETLNRVVLRRFRDESDRELLDVPDGILPHPDIPAPVRFLGTWDAVLLAHARRAGILREEHRPLIFTSKSPQSFPTFTVDGVVAGTWRYQDGAVRITPFDPLKPEVRDEVEAEAEQLAAFHR